MDDMSRERAFEILQLDPSATADKIKAKYENYMRRAKFDDTVDEELITKAYDTLMGIHWGNFEPDPAYSEKGLNKKKVESFFYLYKRHLAYGLAAAVVVIGVLAMIIFGKTKYDYTILLLGSLNIKDQEVMEQYYENLLGVDSVLVDYILIQTDSADGSLTEESMNKLRGYFLGNDADIVIATEDIAKFLSYQGALNDLKPYLPEIGLSSDDQNVLYWYEEGEDGQIAAAVHFGTNSIFAEGINGQVPDYFCLSEGADLTDNTKTVIEDLLAQNK